MVSDNPMAVRACNVLCLITSIFFFALETIQMNDKGFEIYFEDFFNRIDLSMFFVYCFYFVMRWMDDKSLLPL